MKAVILNGSEKDNDTLGSVHEIIVRELTDVGWEVEAFILGDMEIHHCLGCFGCWVRTPGVCVIDDAAREVAKAIIQSDLTVYLTPVTFGGYSPELKKALDRSICLISPFFTRVEGEVHHKVRYEQYPRLMAVGVLPQADDESEEIFTFLVSRNAINFHSPAHAAGVVLSSQGAQEIREEIQALLHQLEVTA